MAEYYCDHGAYASALGTTPTWGVPQEGDGTSKDAATSASIASIAFTTVPTTGTISVCGASVSTTGVIGAASADAAADTLAANINATTNAVSTTFCNSGAPTNVSRLQNIVYARGPSGGAPAGTCQIMARIGSASYNTTCIASTFDGSPTVSQFSGGSGGCWGWVINPAAIGVSSGIAAMAYGCLLYIPTAGTIPTITDNVYVRTGGGASKTINISSSANTTLSHAAYSKTLVFDTNTKWTGDATNGALKLIWTATAWSITLTLSLSVFGQNTSYIALALGGFTMEYINSTGLGTMGVMSAASGSGTSTLHMKNCVMLDSATAGAGGVGLAIGSTANTSAITSVVLESCKLAVTTPRAALWRNLLQFGMYQVSADFRFLGCTFDFNISGVSDPGALLAYQSPSDTVITFEGCSFLGFSSGYTLVSSLSSFATISNKLQITVDGCSGLKMPASYVGMPVSTTFYDQYVHQLVFSNAALSSQAGERIEDVRGVAEWLPDDPTPFPYLSATLLGSGTPYSMRMLWIRAVAHARGRPYKAPPLRMTTQLAAGVRTLTLNMLAPSAMSNNIKCSFHYIDSSGVARRDETELVENSSATWTNAGSYSGYAAKKFSLTTSYPVKANSEIVATIQFFGAPPGSDATVAVYVDPEFVVE